MSHRETQIDHSSYHGNLHKALIISLMVLGITLFIVVGGMSVSKVKDRKMVEGQPRLEQPSHNTGQTPVILTAAESSFATIQPASIQKPTVQHAVSTKSEVGQPAEPVHMPTSQVRQGKSGEITDQHVENVETTRQKGKLDKS